MFGFKENLSTIICTQLLIETIEYYNSNNTDCFILLLDASKAFDRIFTFLCIRKMCPLVLHLNMNMYTCTSKKIVQVKRFFSYSIYYLILIIL